VTFCGDASAIAGSVVTTATIARNVLLMPCRIALHDMDAFNLTAFPVIDTRAADAASRRDPAMSLWARVRDLTAGPERRIVRDLTAAYQHERRMAAQLRAHAERVPYPNLAATLTGLADEEDAHAARLQADIARRGGVANGAIVAETTRPGRNYWERLTIDLEELRAKSRRYLELAQHWDLDDAAAAALFTDLAHEDAAMCRMIADLIARSDPHALD
jgi:rubrerythrin